MRKAINMVVVAVIAAEALVLGQGGDVMKVMAAVREALGGEQKLAAVKTVTATGQYQQAGEQTTHTPTTKQGQPAVSGVPMLVTAPGGGSRWTGADR